MTQKMKAKHCDKDMKGYWAMRNWLNFVERRALGIEHDRMPRFHRGQWVRFIGDPGSVQSNGREPKLGDYAQVMRIWQDGQLLTVLFAGQRGPANARCEMFEQLVGVPIGQPRDHLRLYQRRLIGFQGRMEG